MLESVLKQNYTNYKVIYVDDNSDDKTPQRIRKQLSKLPKLS